MPPLPRGTGESVESVRNGGLVCTVSDHGGSVHEHKACVCCERCSGRTDCVQGLGTLAELGAPSVESRHVWSVRDQLLGSPLWAIRVQEGVGACIYTGTFPCVDVHGCLTACTLTQEALSGSVHGNCPRACRSVCHVWHPMVGV